MRILLYPVALGIAITFTLYISLLIVRRVAGGLYVNL